MTDYAALTDTQRKQVEYLYCDSFLSSDPAAFVYRVDENGQIIYRIPVQARPAASKRRAKVTCQIVYGSHDPHKADRAVMFLAELALSVLLQQPGGESSFLPAQAGALTPQVVPPSGVFSKSPTGE